MRRILIAVTIAASCAPPRPAVDCELINLMPEFLAFWDSTRHVDLDARVTRFRADVVSRSEQLYGPQVRVGADPARLDDDVRAWFRFLAQDDTAFRAMSVQLAAELPRLGPDLAAALPGFRCTAPVYFFFSAGAFDGAVRVVDGRELLLFGVEVASRTQRPGELRAFVGHEMFHLYHRAVTGPEMDSTLYGRVWREGLATLFSRRFAPDVAEEAILGWPRDLAAQVEPRWGEVVDFILEHLDATDEATMHRPLLAAASGDLPPRFGYYVGYLVARELARDLPFETLLRLEGPALREAMAKALRRLQGAAHGAAAGQKR
ncbi:MAG: hypothetical protein KF689_14245 [Gemmatimonadaceae bacterium]|nr:hypothetical protein [Gemmatimonadaceae bacterium]MCW5826852.1 hypothetical protein [Gemmatimonadaceae bacterium]